MTTPENDEYVVAEYVARNSEEFGLFIDVVINKGKHPIATYGPFDTETERMAALKEIMDECEARGAINMPTGGH